jgi:hypothetical protein
VSPGEHFLFSDTLWAQTLEKLFQSWLITTVLVESSEDFTPVI